MSNQDIIEQIDAAICAHGLWKMRLNGSILSGMIESTPAELRCDDRCNFGKWIYGDTIPATHRGSEGYEIVRQLHADFHDCAAEILIDAMNDHADRARDRMRSEYVEHSDRLVRALNQWKHQLRS